MPKKKLPYNDRGGYAYVYVNRKPVALKAPNGRRCKTGTKEALCAYHRFSLGIVDKSAQPDTEPKVTVEELACEYLKYLKELQHVDYSSGVSGLVFPFGIAYFSSESARKFMQYQAGSTTSVRIILRDFLLVLYGDDHLVDSFTPKCLKNVRVMMIKSQRFNRKTINRYIGRIIAIFAWGMVEEFVKETTHRALKLIKPLEKGHPDTWDNPPREDVPFDAVVRLLPFLAPVLQTMIQIQGLHGMRSGEVCRMRVGEIDRSRVEKTGFWY